MGRHHCRELGHGRGDGGIALRGQQTGQGRGPTSGTLSKTANLFKDVTLHCLVWFVARDKRWELRSPSYRLKFVRLAQVSSDAQVPILEKVEQVPGSKQTIVERCFAYALAKATGESLLFKGDDFRLTDVQAAL